MVLHYKIEWTKLAEEDVFEIGKGILKISSSIESAEKWMRVIRGGGESLATFPELGIEYPKRRGVFFTLVGRRRNRYKIYYTIDEREKVVTILRVASAWRDMRRIKL